MKARQATERNDLAAHQRGERQALEQAYDSGDEAAFGCSGASGRTTGSVAILARVSGFNALRRQFEQASRQAPA